MAKGIITKVLGGIYTVQGEDQVINCRARGLFRHKGESPVVGDKVEYEVELADQGVIMEIHERRNIFIRPPVANVDKMIITASAVIPVTEPFLIDRMAAVAMASGVTPVICINKIDMDPADDLYEIYSEAGFDVFCVSAITGEGIDDLMEILYDKVSVFTGNSGVGKSSLLNAIGLNIETGEVSDKLGRGRHTTRHVEIYAVKSKDKERIAYLIDTPGFSSFDTGKMSLTEQSDIELGFPEFKPYLGNCQFRDCSHIKETGCAILKALNEGKIHKSRYRGYARLIETAKTIEANKYK